MGTTDHDASGARSAPEASDTGDGVATVAVDAGDDRQLGPHAPALLAVEHWSLIAARSLIWNEAQSRATVFLTVLSGSIIALALAADATGFGSETTTLALVLLPMVLLLGIAAYVRLVQINTEEFRLVLAMNRLRRAYLTLEPGLEGYLTTGHHDDERGVIATYMLDRPTRQWMTVHFLVNTPTIIATVDAALAAAIVVLGLQTADPPPAAVVAAGAAAFLVVWVALFWLQLPSLRPLRHQTPRFPTPPDAPSLRHPQ
jgi:hypothetical protein